MTVKIDRLKDHPKNPNIHRETQIDEIMRSVKMFGQFRPVLVDEDYTILAGHGLTTAMRKMGEKTIDVRVMKGLDEEQKMKLLLVDNQIATLGSIDYSVVESIFQELSDYDIPGFDQSVLEELLVKTEETINEYGNVSSVDGIEKPSFIDEGKTADIDAIVCPGCGMVLERKKL